MGGSTPCAGCTHRAAFHIERTGRCRVDGCECPRFEAGGEAEADEREEQPAVRRVSVDVPDGYAVSISLVPVAEEVPDAGS